MSDTPTERGMFGAGGGWGGGGGGPWAGMVGVVDLVKIVIDVVRGGAAVVGPSRWVGCGGQVIVEVEIRDLS